MRVAIDAEEARADRVERAEHDLVRGLAEVRDDALAHLARRLVRERDGEDAPRRDGRDVDEVGDAVGDHARLAGAGPGEDQQRAVDGRDGLALGCVEVVEDVHRVPAISVSPERGRDALAPKRLDAGAASAAGGGTQGDIIDDSAYGAPERRMLLAIWEDGNWEAPAAVLAILLVAYLLVLWIAAARLDVSRHHRPHGRPRHARRSQSPSSLIFNLPGLLLYLILRPSETLAAAYDRQLEAEALLHEIQEQPACPSCRRKIEQTSSCARTAARRCGRACDSCGKGLATDVGAVPVLRHGAAPGRTAADDRCGDDRGGTPSRRHRQRRASTATYTPPAAAKASPATEPEPVPEAAAGPAPAPSTPG